MNNHTLKIIGIVGTLILIANLILFAFRIITLLIFWVVIITAALLVWKGLPTLKQN